VADNVVVLLKAVELVVDLVAEEDNPERAGCKCDNGKSANHFPLSHSSLNMLNIDVASLGANGIDIGVALFNSRI